MKIQRTDLVLEVGSGDKPYPRADVLVDKFWEDSSERESEKDLVIDRPLVVADGERLPFSNKSFGYIIASHSLEHTENPAKFIGELMRVGKRGYIETPGFLRERVFNWSFHHWYVDLEKKKLMLVRKTQKSKRFFSGLNDFRRKKLFEITNRDQKLPFVQFEWEGKVDYQLFESEPQGFLENLDKKLSKFVTEENRSDNHISSMKKKYFSPLIKSSFLLKQRLHGLYQKKLRHKVNLLDLIVCPFCKGRLEMIENQLICYFCSRKYCFNQKKIPILLN